MKHQPMTVARITELRLKAFKSFRDAILPLSGTTILTGRNSAGKSNALDGLEVLARLSQGEDMADALDGRRREGGTVRGGSEGLAPHGMDRFEIGCTVVAGADSYDYDVAIEVRPDLRIVGERLYGPGVAVKSGTKSLGPLVETREPGSPGTGIVADLHNGKRGPNAPHTFRDSRLVITQVQLSVSGTNRAELSLLRGVEAVLAALRGVFHLDPVPHLMRGYVPIRDAELRRTGENLSSALYRMSSKDTDAFRQVKGLLRLIADEGVDDLSFVTSELGDVMVALEERRGTGSDRSERTPARQMSDGLLRIAAIATALLSSQHGLDVDSSVAGRSEQAGGYLRGGVLIVIEELENGLHPSQARRVLDLVRSSTSTSDTSVLVTTHSPALLDAAEGTLNDSVIVCHRRDEGYSTLTPIIKLPGYSVALAEGTLGNAIAAGKLVDDKSPDQDYSEFAKLIGID